MFTGLIEEIGRVAALERRGASAALTIEASFGGDPVKLGDSIAVNGVCLTVSTMAPGRFTFDVSPETVERSSFRYFAAGSPVNLERALRLSDRLGGHLVTGHVDCLGVVTGRRTISGNIEFSFRVPEKVLPQLVEKGSVAVDGVSLTVNSVTGEGFTVNVIPHTGSRTTLDGKQAGAAVNIETDILGKYVERLLGQDRQKKEAVSLELLARNGFL